MCEVNNQRLRQIILRIQDIEIEKLTVQNKITANNEYKHLTTLLISNYRYVHVFLKAKANYFQDPSIPRLITMHLKQLQFTKLRFYLVNDPQWRKRSTRQTAIQPSTFRIRFGFCE
jgi:hypothetical protein